MSSKTYSLTFLLFLTFLFICGCNETPKPPTVSVAIQSDAVTKAKLENLLRSNPVFVKPPSGTEYSLKIVKPDPTIDYKIAIIRPDPNINYSIIVIDPKTRKDISNLSPEIRNALSKLLKQRKNQEKK
jgi:hypothetical protein